MRHFVIFLPPLVSLGFAAMLLSTVSGCCRGPLCDNDEGVGGGQDVVTVHLPFNADTTSRCVQGAGGNYSHRYDSTAYDVDFDTPNNERLPVYAPADGVLYVHDDDRTTGFGVHGNIDLGDGTYIIIGHLDDVFVDNASEVAAGQLIAYEGTTGSSTGDHVHMGRHDGDPAQDAAYGESIEGLALSLYDMSDDGNLGEWTTSELVCDLSTGHVYASSLETPLWHPNGSLVKTPSENTVYLIEDGALRAFWTEDAFWSRGYSFADVALIDDREFACYNGGANITGNDTVTGAYDNGVVWLVDQGNRQRQRVPAVGWQSVLKSWGVAASTYDDLATAEDVDLSELDEIADEASFRDGSLVSEVSSSTVYVVSDGIAMPIESWDVYLLMGFGNRAVIEVDDGTVRAVMSRIGDCATNAYCVSRDDVTTCGGPNAEDEATYAESEQTATGGGFTLSWTTPDGLPADRIALSGEYVGAEGAEGWRDLASASSQSSVTYAVPDAVSGRSLRFSVAYTRGSATTWSCLAPYPPGTVQGTTLATWNGTTLAVLPADDPSSDGCGLVVSF